MIEWNRQLLVVISKVCRVTLTLFPPNCQFQDFFSPQIAIWNAGNMVLDSALLQGVG